MAKSVKGSRTEKNLVTAFAGESQARNRYTYFASAARKEGLEQVAKICRACDTAMMEGYMATEPKLLALRAPDLGDDATGPRCMQMWTYDKTVIEKMPTDLKQVIMDSTKKILKERGVKL